MRYRGVRRDVEVDQSLQSRVREAIVSDDRIVIDYDDPIDGEGWHILAKSGDGIRYSGTFGNPKLDPDATIEIPRFVSADGRCLLWCEWHDQQTGRRGCEVYELTTVPNSA